MIAQFEIIEISLEEETDTCLIFAECYDVVITFKENYMYKFLICVN